MKFEPGTFQAQSGRSATDLYSVLSGVVGSKYTDMNHFCSADGGNKAGLLKSSQNMKICSYCAV
jgi:hypothetical protein